MAARGYPRRARTGSPSSPDQAAVCPFGSLTARMRSMVTMLRSPLVWAGLLALALGCARRPSPGMTEGRNASSTQASLASGAPTTPRAAPSESRGPHSAENARPSSPARVSRANRTTSLDTKLDGRVRLPGLPSQKHLVASVSVSSGRAERRSPGTPSRPSIRRRRSTPASTLGWVSAGSSKVTRSPAGGCPPGRRPPGSSSWYLQDVRARPIAARPSAIPRPRP